MLNSEEYGECSRQMGVLEQNTRDMKTMTRDNVATSERINYQAIDQIRQYREEVRVMFDELEQNLITHVKTITSGDKQKLQDLENELTELSRTIEQLRLEDKNLVTSSRVCQQMKIWRDAMSDIEGKLRKVKTSNVIRLFSFDPNNDIKIVSSKYGLGQIVILNGQIEETGTAIPEDSQPITDKIETSMPCNCTGDTSVDEINELLSQIEAVGTPMVDTTALNEIENVEQEKTHKLEAMRTYESSDDKSGGSCNPEVKKHLDSELHLNSFRRDGIAESSNTSLNNEIAAAKTCKEEQEKRPDCDVPLELSAGVNQGESSATASVVFKDAANYGYEQKGTYPKIDFQFENEDISSKDDNHHTVIANAKERADVDAKEQLESLNTVDKKINDRDTSLKFQFDSAFAGTQEGRPDIPEIEVNNDLYKRTRNILNKLVPENFPTVVSQMQALPIDSETKLKGVVHIVFEVAIACSVPQSMVALAYLCRSLSMLKVPSENKPKEQVIFREVLLSLCQREFEKDKSPDILLKEKRQQIDAAEPGSMRDTLEADLECAESNAKARSLGNVRFIGELFKLNVLTEYIMHDCVFKLLRTKDPDNLECLCLLLTSIGKELDVYMAKPRMDQYFEHIVKIINDKKMSPRVRFLLQDVVDLRMNRWVPNQEANKFNLSGIAHKKTSSTASGSLGRTGKRSRRFISYDMHSEEITIALKKLIITKNAENKAVFDWINTNVDEPFRNNHLFIRTLVWAICYGAITGNKHKKRVVSEKIIRRKDLLMTYITDKPDLELHALLTLQALATQLKHPPGVLRSICDVLHGSGVISEDVFLRWKYSKIEPEGKIVCLNDLDQFFLLINFKRQIDAATVPYMSSKEIWVSLKTLICIGNVENKAVFDWINTHVDEPVTNMRQFIRPLIMTICFGAIIDNVDDERAISENIIRRKDLLMTYVTNKPDLELHALYAVQALVTHLKHPPGMLRAIFDALHDNGVISEDVFLQWRWTKVRPDGKIVCLNELQQFYLQINFKRLCDADTRE